MTSNLLYMVIALLFVTALSLGGCAEIRNGGGLITTSNTEIVRDQCIRWEQLGGVSIARRC